MSMIRAIVAHWWFFLRCFDLVYDPLDCNRRKVLQSYLITFRTVVRQAHALPFLAALTLRKRFRHRILLEWNIFLIGILVAPCHDYRSWWCCIELLTVPIIH